MCCIREGNGGKNHYCCCCIPIWIGVVILTVVTVMDLITAIRIEDWISTAIYSILTLCFVVSFIKKDGAYRSHLYHAYLIGFILTLIYVFYFCFFSGKVQNRAQNICGTAEKVINWENCDQTVDDYIWWFVALYLITLIMVRLFFVRLLHAWKDQGEVRGAEYKNLDGHGNNKEHHAQVNEHHDHGNGDHGHGNTMH